MSETEKRLVGPDTAIRNYPRLLRRYARLLELTSDLVSTLELDTLLKHIVDAAKELTNSAGASLLLYDSTSHQMYFEAATDELIAGLNRTAVPAENSFAGWIFTHNEPVISDDVLNDPRFFREVDVLTQFRTQTLLGVPLRTKDHTIGVIEAVNKRKGKFNDEDLQILQALAAQAAIAITNSRLFKQSDLVAEIVHELRTPLASLTAASHLLQREGIPEDQRLKLADTIFSEVMRLNDMATNFLEFARLESGRVRMNREPIHLGGLIRECLEVIRPQAEADRITLETEIDPSIAPVDGDRNMLKQLLLNLLTNAIKYNQREGQVKVSLLREGGEVAIAVKDTGHGIAPEYLKRLFERFYRVPDEAGRVKGSGLGLAIAKRIAESHHGNIDVVSALGEGSTFIVRLPLGAAQPS